MNHNSTNTDINDEYTTTATTVPYVPEDLDGLKRKALVALVARQLHLWPSAGPHGKFVRSKTTIAAMRNVLLTESLGFTKTAHVRVPMSRCGTHNPTPEDGDASEDASAQPARIFSLSEAHEEGDGTNVMVNMGHFGFSHDGTEEYSLPVTNTVTGGPTQPQQEIALTHREPDTLSTTATGPSIVPEVTTDINPIMLMSMPSLDHCNANPTITFPDFSTYAQTTVDIPAATVTSTDHIPPCGETLRLESLPADEKKQAAAAGKDAEVDWLKDIVQKRPGWQAFINGMNHNQQNPDVAQSWRFAVAFAKEYNKTVSKSAGRLGKPVLKKSIVRALRYGTTWMSGAEQAVRVLDVYGEGGRNPSPDVIEKVAHRTGEHETPCGSGALLEWLLKWEKEHK